MAKVFALLFKNQNYLYTVEIQRLLEIVITLKSK